MAKVFIKNTPIKGNSIYGDKIRSRVCHHQPRDFWKITSLCTFSSVEYNNQIKWSPPRANIWEICAP